jgi:branched-chain amino acid transport system substrate-binding protein
MLTGRRFKGVAALMALALLFSSACSQRDDDDDTTSGGGESGGGGEAAGIDTENCGSDPTAEIEGDTIKLVSSYPQSGSAASLAEVAAGWESYFQKVNDDGGVEVAGNTYTIEYESKDDEYDPGQTATNITELVGADGSGAFAVFAAIGTAGNLAIREQLNDLCVPQLHAASGSPAWGNPDFPWTVGATNPVYTLEAQVFVDLLERENPDAQIAMLVQDDDFGRAYEEGVAAAVEGTDMEVVEIQRYAPGILTDVSPQMSALTASGADTFFDGGVGLPCSQGVSAAKEANWEREITWITSVCPSKTILSQDPEAFADGYTAGNLKNPMDPQFDDDEAMTEFKDALEQYSPDTDTDSGNAAFGWNEASLFVQALENAEAPTRLALLESYRDLEAGDDVGLLGPGISVQLTDEDRYLGEQLQLAQFVYNGPDDWYVTATDDEIADFNGEAAEITPEDLITG